MQNLEILAFDANNASEDEWKLYHDFRKSRYIDKGSPKGPSHKITDAKFEEIMKIPPKKLNVLRYNVFENGNLKKQIGDVYFSYYKKDRIDKKVAMVNISILSAYRKKGYGKVLLAKLVELAKRHNKSKLLFQTTEKSGIKTIENFGAVKLSEHQQFKLKVNETDWDLVKKWSNLQSSNEASLEWVKVTEDIPDNIIDQYIRIFSTSLDEHPKWHINKRRESLVTPEMIKQDIKNLVTLKGGKWDLLLIREKNGDISGLTELKWNPSRPSNILQLITHIKLQYRGKGRGKLLKAKSLEYVKNQYPEVDTVKIGYVGEKGMPLYEMNKRLGFKRQYQQISYEIETENLEKWINKSN